MYPIINSRRFFAWRMLAAARAQEERSHLSSMRARSRASFNPLEDLPENEFVKIYRLTKNSFKYLCENLRELTDFKSTQRVNLETKVLTALFFFARGCYQRHVGIAKHVSQKTSSVYIKQVTQALIHPNMLKRYIRFPQTIAERQLISQRFYMKYGIPGDIGCNDASHFHIFRPPKEVEHLYFCRKQHYSINVQMICDSDYKVINVNPKYGGANHDAFIWENSDINNYMQSLHVTGEMVWLLGDSGYPQRPWLMTPISNPATGSPEANYNNKHVATRVVIKNVFGWIKNRWRCLSKHRVLHYKPLKCSQIILACSVLYSIALQFHVPEPEMNLNEAEDVSIQNYREPTGIATTDLIRGRAIREQLVRKLQQ